MAKISFVEKGSDYEKNIKINSNIYDYWYICLWINGKYCQF